MMYSTVYQMLALILPLVTIPYVSRVLGATGIGINAFTSSFAAYFVLIAYIGIKTYGNREIAYHQRDQKERSKIFFELNILKFITVLIAVIGYLIFIAFQSHWQLYFLLQGLAILAVLFDSSWYFMGVENFQIIVLRNTAIQVLFVVATFVFVRSTHDLWIYILLVAGSPLMGNLTVWPFLKRELVRVKIKELQVWRHLKPTLALFLPSIIISIYLSLNKSMLGALDNVQSAGFFAQSDSIVRAAYTLVTAFGAAFLPRLSSMLSEKKTDEAKAMSLKSLEISNALTFFIVAGIMGVSHSFAIFFFGKEFKEVGDVMFVQSLMIIFIAWSFVLGQQYLLAARRNKEFALAHVPAVIANVLLNIILIPIIGVMGAVIATIATEAAVAFTELWFLRKLFRPSEFFHGLWKYVLSAFLSFAAIFYLDYIMPVSIVSYLIQAITGFLVYVVCLFLFRAGVIPVVKPVVGPYLNKILKKN
ncbi:flippase [Lactococcus termiticola]|uniref:Flippase n=2 Tax=Lactococcus termiticola TaxID=2169526 RepID=A0A2R5HEN2_9LACT|nr:flippase [Lactococcus termiticola]